MADVQKYMFRLGGSLAFLVCGRGGSFSSQEEVWRVAEDVEGVPLGTAVTFTGEELLAGNRGLAFRGPSRTPYHIELVRKDDLPSFLDRRTPASSSSSFHMASRFELTPEICRTGKFLLNDPRVGLFHNQRLSYETALDVAIALGRILVVPGFFKFPHPEAYAGTQWVPLSWLFDFSVLRSCYGRIVELEVLIESCGAEVLEGHVAVPFETLWMRSKGKAPWINGTRPELVWAAPSGQVHRFRPRRTEEETPVKLEERFGHLLTPFLEDGVAQARTVRAHGLIAKNVSMDNSTACFFPSKSTLQDATNLAVALGVVGASGEPPPKVLGLHVRLFKASTVTSGGYIPPELRSMQESLCNLEAEIFTIIAHTTLVRSFGGFWPTHTYIASNEADPELLSRYLSGFPGPRRNMYTTASYDAAVSVEECAAALRSVLVDAIIAAWADYFLGNVCSTMSQYIFQLRLWWGRAYNTTMMLGGVQHAALLESARKLVAEQGSDV